ncbi:hypothetical protein [Rhodococcus sp. NPDC047139]|uniref:hypothetical protein n=1 Tax=Rhodococcus sp. NPDC047139 TaxID=3155141 RepID=UPI0033CD9113
MAYTAEKPGPRATSDQLRARIPGWGVDLDPRDRPSVPKERFAPEVTGAHWDFPERQPGYDTRERSIEHAFVTPVFGTAAPLKGLSGAVRRYAYRRYSEGRAAHWLLLIGADRIDVVESRIRAVLQGKPDNPVTESGLRSEITGHGGSARRRSPRADVKHQWLDPFVSGAPWIAAAGFVAAAVGRRKTRAQKREDARG